LVVAARTLAQVAEDDRVAEMGIDQRGLRWTPHVAL
jgi:hypothetical protein